MRIITILLLAATLVAGLAAFQNGRMPPPVSAMGSILEIQTPIPAPTSPPPTPAPSPTHPPPVPTPHPCDGKVPATPSLRVPAEGAIVPADNVVLRWSRSKCAYRFQIHVVRATRNAETVFYSQEFPAHSIKLPALETGVYIWHVRGCFRQVCGEWSPWRHFVVLRK